jgi:hypothetical protein
MRPLEPQGQVRWSGLQKLLAGVAVLAWSPILIFAAIFVGPIILRWMGTLLESGAVAAASATGAYYGGVAGGLLCGPICAFGGGFVGAVFGGEVAARLSSRYKLMSVEPSFEF